MKSADKPAATENTIDSKMFSLHPLNIRIPTVTDIIKVMVMMEYRLRTKLNVVSKMTRNATAIAIPASKEKKKN